MTCRVETRSGRHLLVALLCLSIGALSAPAAVITVGSAGQYPTIQQAVNAAVGGDEISVSTGTYSENVTVNKSLTFTGTPFGAAITVTGLPGDMLGLTTVTVVGDFTGDAITVNFGGVLTGTGKVGFIYVNAGGILQGNLTTIGLQMNSGSYFYEMLRANNTYDTINILGGPNTVALGTLTVFLANGYTPAVGTTFPIITGSLPDTFTGLPNNAAFSVGGVTFRINYGSATLTVVASTVTNAIPALSLPGLILLALCLGTLPLLLGWKRSTPHAG